MKNRSLVINRLALASVASAVSLACSPAWSLGLGRLSVQSSLGEALRAEIDVTSLTPDEAASLRARVATPDAYRAAGVDFNAALEGAQVLLAKRPDGRSYLRIQGERSLQEPFVDVILDLSWATGRLTREYTMLIDPATRAVAAAPAPQAAPVVSAPAPAPAPRAPRPAPVVAEKRPAPAPAPAPAGADGYRVRSGDTLSRIASANARPGVSLDQMLVALYRSNPQAFVDNNMNRLRAGVVLSIPGADGAAQVPLPEARQVIQAQAADFDAYRQRLAGRVPSAPATGTTRVATGQVQVEDRKAAAAASSPDKLTLSRGTPQASAAEAKIASDAERKAADVRVAELARNVKELQKLTAPASAAASGAGAAPLVAAAPAPASGVSVPIATPPAVAASPTDAALASAVAAAASLDSASAAQAAKAASAPKAPMAPAQAEAPSGFASWLDSPYVLPAAGALGVILLGVGGLAYSRRRRSAGSETSFMESRLQADSFFGASGGKRVDTRDNTASGSSASPSSLSYSLSQLDAIGDVDPVAEADVYLAYGRDLQAEEILKEALRTDGNRLAIRTKLLEVYAKRADAKAFEMQALELRDITQGQGEDWARVQEAGRQLDPDNALYVAGTDGRPAIDAQADAESDLTMPSALVAPDTQQSELLAPRTVIEPGRVTDTGDLDLDLTADSGSGLSGSEATERMSLGGMEQTQPISLDAMLPPTPAPLGSSLDFDLDTGETARPAPPAAAPAPPPAFDFGDLSLDLDEPVTGGGVIDDSPTAPDTLHDTLRDVPAESVESDDAVSRKLELADEFRRIGDIEGARDLLEEVIARTNGAMKAKAEGMLRDLD